MSDEDRDKGLWPEITVYAVVLLFLAAVLGLAIVLSETDATTNDDTWDRYLGFGGLTMAGLGIGAMVHEAHVAPTLRTPHQIAVLATTAVGILLSVLSVAALDAGGWVVLALGAGVGVGIAGSVAATRWCGFAPPK